MDGSVKFWHLILILIIGFVAFYIWVEIGGRHGVAPSYNKPLNVQEETKAK